MFNRKRVVVTGMGVISPVGLTIDEFWKSLLEGKSGVDYITKFDTTNFTTKFAAEVRNFDPTNYMDKKLAQRMDIFSVIFVFNKIKRGETNAPPYRFLRLPELLL